MLKIYKDLDFYKWQKKSKIADLHLVNAIKEIESGLYDAKLGDLFKKELLNLVWVKVVDFVQL
jgi:hypothetical protein